MRLAAVAAVCALVAVPAAAKERDGVTSPATLVVGGKQVHLNGMGLRTKVIFKVYVASFYLEVPTTDAKQAISSDQVKRVEMHMLRDLERGKITEAVQNGFEKNSAAEMPRLQERLDTFLKAIPDLRETEVIEITYVPGKGTAIKAGKAAEIVIPGKDFADALFSVWLGEHPVDGGLKEDMLKDR
jgi:hypothetical protein